LVKEIRKSSLEVPGTKIWRWRTPHGWSRALWKFQVRKFGGGGLHMDGAGVNVVLKLVYPLVIVQLRYAHK
jgi:hypothetical protein